jgi:UV DNA damage endonuclease
MIRFGYACICTQLSSQGIRTGRTMIDRKFKAGGMQLASQISLQNAKDLLPILKWNVANGIHLFRIGSEMFPRWNHYEIKDLPDYEEIGRVLQEAGDYARANNIRLTTHPGPFHILGSPDPVVVENSIVGLERHSEMFDMLGYAPSFDNKINIHIGATYNDKTATITRWIRNYYRLSESCRARLVIENDDKASMYSVRELYQMVHIVTGIPITFDYWHHTFNTGDLTEEEAFFMARDTWQKHGVTQCTHYSESRRREQQRLIEGICEQHNIAWEDLPKWPTFAKAYKEFSKIREQAHSDYILTTPNTYGVDSVDIVVEAKAKELALQNINVQCCQTPLILD